MGAPTARAHFQRTCASAWGGRLAPRCENAHAGKGIVRGRGKGGQHRRSIGAVIYVPQYVCAATRGLHVNMYLHAHSQSKGYLPAWAQPWKEQLPIDRYMGLSLSDALPTALSLSIRKFLVELNTQLNLRKREAEHADQNLKFCREKRASTAPARSAGAKSLK